MICSPAAPSTCTLPFTRAATSELVVPRSMPTMISGTGVSLGGGRIAGHLDLGKAEHAAIGGIAGAEHLEHRARGRGRGHRHLYRPHPPRIERLAERGDRVD